MTNNAQRGPSFTQARSVYLASGRSNCQYLWIKIF
jgi:hypothetical protein